MTIEQFLPSLTQSIFLFLAVSTLFNWAKYRNRARFDTAMVFVSLALAIIARELRQLLPAWDSVLALIFFIALLSQPYLLLRVAQYFHLIPAFIPVVALFGLVLVFASIPLSPFAPTLVFSFAIGYFLIVEGYVAFLLIKGALIFRGVPGRRLRLASIGTGLLALVFLIALVMLIYESSNGPAAPAMESAIAALIQILAALSGMSYYFGFSPPRWLRRSWQLRELYQYLQQISKRGNYNLSTAFEELSTAALRTVGGTTAVIVGWDESSKCLKIKVPGNPPLQVENLEYELVHNDLSWDEQPARVARLPEDVRSGLAGWGKLFGARALIIVPINGSLHFWGVLIVAIRYAPLFAQDDLDMLSLLVEHAVIMLEHSSLVAELRNANQALEKEVSKRKQTEGKFRGLLESAPDAMVVVDKTGVIDLFNSQAEKLFGYDRAEIVGKPVEVLVPKSLQRKHVHHRQGYFVEHPARPMGLGLDLFGLRKDASEFPVEISLSPLETDEGLLVIAAIRDVTERRRAEVDIQKLNHDLKQYAAQLEAANKELESFSYSVSHDLRAPLRGIDGFSQVLIEDYGDHLPPEARGYLDRVRASAQRMAGLIDDLINLARVTRTAPRFKLINLSVIAEEIIKTLREAHPNRRVTVSIEPEMRVNGDPNLMRIALENLLGNAWKFTSRRERAVIEFGQKQINEQRTFHVRDNGAGFDMTYAHRLFGAFQRLHSAGEFPGTGIGLATVHRIISIHGGRVWAEAEDGKGATFYFTL
ncbi:MAG TPA: PAS domain S-box protein [Anaerolineales bacterium]|nr:PAS domain S-box protein [Anaerolineales bacterium]